MLIEYISSDLNVQLLFGLALGVLFGIAAQVSRFCLRRSVAAEEGADRAGLAVWLLALATAIVGVQIAQGVGFADLGDHRFLSTNIPAAGIAIGGLLFGVGMVLTRGCVTRLTVLSATGNLRALTVLIVFAVTAHAMMKGILAPLRTSLGSVTVDLPLSSLAALPGASLAVPALLVAGVFWLARRARPTALDLSMGVVIGLVVTAGWVGTSTLFMDEFDPAPIQSLAFTLPWTETLFWVVASTAIPAGFGTGLIGGVLVGALLSALVRGEVALVSFSDAHQTLRYGAGGVLMGVGGVLAGGCTIGAGLSGGAMLSVSAILALGSIIAGALLARHVMGSREGMGALA